VGVFSECSVVSQKAKVLHLNKRVFQPAWLIFRGYQYVFGMENTTIIRCIRGDPITSDAGRIFWPMQPAMRVPYSQSK